MRARLKVAGNAERQIQQASDWWFDNRLAAEGLFRQELGRAFELICSQPAAGPKATNVVLPNVRRVLLARTGYYLYYSYATEGTDSVVSVLGRRSMLFSRA